MPNSKALQEAKQRSNASVYTTIYTALIASHKRGEAIVLSCPHANIDNLHVGLRKAKHREKLAGNTEYADYSIDIVPLEHNILPEETVTVTLQPKKFLQKLLKKSAMPDSPEPYTYDDM